MLLTEQQTVFKWLKDILQLPVYADVYKGALELLDNKPSGYITFVSHAGRDLINCLAATTIGADGGRDQYKDNLDNLKKCWNEDWAQEGTEDGHLIPNATCKSVQKLIDDDEAGHMRASDLVNLFFTTFLDYADRERISPNLNQKSEKARKWFVKYAHVREPGFRDNTTSEVERHFRTLDELLYVAACSQFGRIRILDGILKSQKKPKYGIIVDRALELVKNRFDHQYFFTRLENPHWIQPLANRRCFQSPPMVMHFDDGSVQFPMWPELRYLKNVASDVPNEVIKLVLALPEVDNPRIYSELLEIALQLPGNYSAKLEPKILEYVDLEHHFLANRFANVLAYWTSENQTDAALTLTKTLVEFVPDPQDKTKRERRKEEQTDLAAIAAKMAETQLKPSPRIGGREYLKVLSEGVRPLAEKEPYKVARIFIDATENLIRLRTHQEDLNNNVDYSKYRCERLTESQGDFKNAEKSLVHILTFACEQVYEKLPDSVFELDKTLREQQAPLFKRLRHHLYAQHPNDTTKPWIQELIREHDVYDWLEHEYEFQRMVKCACKRFGESLLTEDERDGIFTAIRRGPSKENHQTWLKWLGEQFTDEGFKKRQRHFHRIQFKPFASLLSGDHADYFHELEMEANAPISDEDYAPRKTRARRVSTRSPHSTEYLEGLTDEELLSFINDWNEKEIIFEGNHPIEINIQGLSREFQTVFKERILPNPKRHRFWMENRSRIERPVFVERIIYVMREHVEANDFDNLDEWLTFSEWVLSHPDDGEHGIYDRHDGESRDKPNWSNSRWAMGDFIGSCFRTDVNPPVSARGRLARLLDMFCTQFDWRLDRNSTEKEPVDTNMNTPRCRALEALVNFGLWLRRNDRKSEVSEVMTILEKRFSPEAEYPLTPPEYAILGKNYNWLFHLNKAWTTAHKSVLFPQDEFPKWLAAFDNFLGFNSLSKQTFEIFQDDFIFSLEHLPDIKKQDRPDDKLIEMISQCLFIFYLEKLYPLTGKESLLEGYYQASDDDREQWANLFDYVGHRLWNATEQLDINEEKRIIRFFEWRFEVREPMELQQFTYWLKAECLDAQWRLSAYSKILDISSAEDMSITMEVEALCDMLPDHTEKVVECFAKLTKDIGGNNISIFTEEATAILQAGRKSRKEGVQQNARHARENLLREGRFDLMELGD